MIASVSTSGPGCIIIQDSLEATTGITRLMLHGAVGVDGQLQEIVRMVNKDVGLELRN